MRRAGTLVAVAALATAPFLTAGAQSVTVGTADPTQANCKPFGCPSFFGISRYQQVFSASAFAGITGPIDITGLSFFHNPMAGMNLADAVFTIFLSSTSAGVNGLSTNLASNVGANNAAFATFTSTGQLAPNQLDITGTSFLYDPTLGANLLMDIFVSGVGADGFFAFLETDPDGPMTSREYVEDGTVVADGMGLVTMFTYSPANAPTVTPEPATLSLLGTGLLGLGGWRRRRRARIATT